MPSLLVPCSLDWHACLQRATTAIYLLATAGMRELDANTQVKLPADIKPCHTLSRLVRPCHALSVDDRTRD